MLREDWPGALFTVPASRVVVSAAFWTQGWAAVLTPSEILAKLGSSARHRSNQVEQFVVAVGEHPADHASRRLNGGSSQGEQSLKSLAVGNTKSGNCEVSSLALQQSTFGGCDVGEVAGVDAAEEPQVPVIQVPGPCDLGSLTNEVGRAQGLHHPSLPSQTFFRREIRGCSARRELLPCRSPSPTSAKRRYGPGRGGRRGRRQLPTRARAVLNAAQKGVTVGIAGVRGGASRTTKPSQREYSP